jgi:hypothetical protein
VDVRSPWDGMLNSMFQDMTRRSVPRASGAAAAGELPGGGSGLQWEGEGAYMWGSRMRRGGGGGGVGCDVDTCMLDG